MFKTQTAIFIKNISVNLLVDVWLLVLTFFFTPIVIKTLGAARFGILVLAQMISGYGLLFDFGLPVALVKFFAEKKEEKELKKLFFSGFLILLFLGFVIGLLIFAISNFLATNVFHLKAPLLEETILVFKLVALDVFFGFINILPFAFLQARQRFEFSSIKPFLYGTAATLGYAILLGKGFSLSKLMILNIFTTLLTGLLLFLFSTKFLRFKISFSCKLLKKILRFGFFRFLTNIFSYLNVNIGKTLIGIFFSSSLVSFLSIPLQITQRILGLSTHITTALLPVISKKAEDKNELEEIFFKTTVFAAMIIIPLLSFVTLNSFKILSLWISPDFAEESYLILTFLGLGAIIASVTAIPAVVAEGIGKPEIVSKFAGFNALITTVFSLILIPLYKGLGAAFANSLGKILQAPIFILLIIFKIIKTRRLQQTLFLQLTKIILFSLTFSYLISFIFKKAETIFMLFPIFLIYFVLNLILFLLTKTLRLAELKRIIQSFR